MIYRVPRWGLVLHIAIWSSQLRSGEDDGEKEGGEEGGEEGEGEKTGGEHR